jgi:mRNA-degrading endonuclease RelE of RelBE toxin-antitoxin system
VKAQVSYEHTSPHEFLDLPREIQLTSRKALEAIARDPLHPPPELDLIRLRDHPGYWRLAVGDYRVIYQAAAGKVEARFIEIRTPMTYGQLKELP